MEGEMGRHPHCSNEIGMNKGVWSQNEDELLTKFVNIYGEGKWRSLAQKAGLNRSGKSCRLRWLNYLRPGIKRGHFSNDEEDLIIRLHRLLGNRWALIAGRIPERTDNEIKNYWNTIMVKKLKRNDKILTKKSPAEENGNQVAGENFLINNEGEISNSFPTITIDNDDSLNFLMDIEVNNDLISEMLKTDYDNNSFTLFEDRNKVENEMNCESNELCLALEMKKLASFLDLEDL